MHRPLQRVPASRRAWLVAVVCVVAGVGCSKGKANRGGNRPKGPKTMGNLLVDGYIDDLRKGPAAKRITAAQELGNMGAAAKDALPALEALAKDGDAKVRTAVQAAIKAVRKK